MVKIFLFSLTTLFWFGFSASAQPKPKVIQLTQKDAAELVLKQGSRSKEVDLTHLQSRLAATEALAAYDWKLNLETGYQLDKSQSFNPAMPVGARYDRYKTALTLLKPLTTGTTLGLEINRLSQKADIPFSSAPTITTGTPGQQTQDSFGFTLEQSLLGNFFGMADRAVVNAAQSTFKADEIIRANDLQTVALDAIRLFWDTYVAQENFKESLASRDRNKKLLEAVKRKTSLGYANPGDLAQAQAQYEIRDQGVKSASLDYVGKLNNLITTLGLEPGVEIEFVVKEELPPVPKLAEIKTENLRSVISQKLKVQAAQDLLRASKSQSYPTLNFVGKVYTTGADETSEGSYANAVSGTHPQYYAGIKLAYNFGSDSLTENIINRKAAKELAEAVLARQLLETQDQLSQAERKVQSTYGIAESARRQKDYLEKAINELNRSFNQGRTDIKTLIDVMNSYFSSEVQLSRAVGDYQIALNEWAALRDELISGTKETK